MKNAKFGTKDIALIAVIVVLVLAFCYYFFFLKPLNEDLAATKQRSLELDTEIATVSAKMVNMSAMQAELDEVYARPEKEITEIAPYDNAKVVMNELNGILSRSENYRLTFADPVIGADGTVRRTVNMSFQCSSYSAAKTIVENLSMSHWRCLMKNLTVSADEEGIQEGPVSCSATIVFFESTNLS